MKTRERERERERESERLEMFGPACCARAATSFYNLHVVEREPANSAIDFTLPPSTIVLLEDLENETGIRFRLFCFGVRTTHGFGFLGVP
jgi:hypothetical protein